MTRSPMIAAAAAASCLALSACNGGGAPEATSTSSATSSSSTPTTDYKDEAVVAVKAWIEDDAARLTAENATPKMVAKQKQVDAVDKKAGITTKGHDSVVSTEVGLADPASVTLNVCFTTDQKVLQKGKNVRTDRAGNLVKPGDRQLATVRMTREVGTKDWRVADSEVRKISC